MNDRYRTTILALLGGLIAGLVLILLVVVFTSGDGDGTAVTTTEPTTTATTTTTTTAPSTTAPASTSTTVATTTTTTTPTTTTEPFSGDTGVKGTPASSGSPGALTDIRLGEHIGFTRIVLDFEGSGEHWWEVGYGEVFGGGSGEPCDPDGPDTLGVMAQPATAFWVEQTYFGPTEIEPGFASSVVEILVCDDFEGVLQLAIGVDGEKPFDAFVMQDPLRLVIDVAD